MAWHCKATGGYAESTSEAKANATAIYNVLSNLGWTRAAVAAFLGNVEAESGMNPWRWESDSILASTDTEGRQAYNHGYGLVQFTPASKYIDASYPQTVSGYGPNYSDKTGSVRDGNAQLYFINYFADYSATDDYPISYADFKKATLNDYTIQYLTAAWQANYERPLVITDRSAAARYWYEYLGGVIPAAKLPIWMYFKFNERGK